MFNASLKTLTGLSTALWLSAISVISAQAADVPSGLPKQAAAALVKARQWQPDAELESIVYSAGVMAPLQFVVHSRSSGQGEILINLGGEFSGHPYDLGKDCCSPRIPVDFVDLPKALATARAAGFQGPVTIATLRPAVTLDRGAVPAWRINEFVVDAKSGALIPASLIDDPYKRTEAEFRRNQAERNRQQAAAQTQNQETSEGCRWVYPRVIPGPDGKMKPNLGGVYGRKVCP